MKRFIRFITCRPRHQHRLFISVFAATFICLVHIYQLSLEPESGNQESVSIIEYKLPQTTNECRNCVTFSSNNYTQNDTLRMSKEQRRKRRKQMSTGTEVTPTTDPKRHKTRKQNSTTTKGPLLKPHKCSNSTKRSRQLHDVTDQFHFLPEFQNPCYLHTWEEAYTADRWKGFPLPDAHFTYRALRDLAPKSVSTLSVNFADNKENAEENKGDQEIDMSTRGSPSTDPTCRIMLRCLPYYLIVGFSQNGVVDMQNMLLSHSEVLGMRNPNVKWFNHDRFEYKSSSSFQSFIDRFQPHANTLTERFKANDTDTQVNGIMGHASLYTMERWSGFDIDLRYQSDIINKPIDPSDLFAYSTPRLIEALMPNARFIVMLRDPVERVKRIYSRGTNPGQITDYHRDFLNGVMNGIAWWEACMNNPELTVYHCMYGPIETVSFTSVPCSWHNLSINAIRTSIYHLYINEWLSVFPYERFLFVSSKALALKPQYVFDRVTLFLGLQQETLINLKQSDLETKSNLLPGFDASDAKVLLKHFFQSHTEKSLSLIKGPNKVS